MGSAAKKNEYVLRPHDEEEISRLEHQHQVWKHDTDTVMERAGFKRGDHLLDLGCGPGFLTFDLAGLTGPTGSVLALDSSERFIRYLRGQSRVRQLSWVRARLGDARKIECRGSALDGAICRWVLMFLADAERVVSSVARALRPGGTFAVMEYVHFKSISLWPGGKSFRRIYDAVYEMIECSGGDADVGGRVPGLLAKSGFEIVDLLPILRVGRPGTPLWDWLDATRQNHPNLIEAGFITAAELESYHREWEDHAANPAAFFTAPPLLATIARKS
jgi:SAM-dependent methyltransferase